MKTAPMHVGLVGCYGDDLLVANAARVSMHKFHEEFTDGDERLIGYLARENHFVPFCHPHVTFRVKAPIFVARQLVKHQIGLSWSEVSRRYVDEEPEFWFPDVWHVRPDGSIKQGAGGEHPAGNVWEMAVAMNVGAMLKLYLEMIADGVAPEEARMVLPLNCMTEWVWTGSLQAWARVCKLRLDPHAQGATREVALLISAHMNRLFPVSWKELV